MKKTLVIIFALLLVPAISLADSYDQTKQVLKQSFDVIRDQPVLIKDSEAVLEAVKGLQAVYKAVGDLQKEHKKLVKDLADCQKKADACEVPKGEKNETKSSN